MWMLTSLNFLDVGEEMGEKEAEEQVLPVFVSVDPHRDSLEHIKKYTKGWHLSFHFFDLFRHDVETFPTPQSSIPGFWA